MKLLDTKNIHVVFRRWQGAKPGAGSHPLHFQASLTKLVESCSRILRDGIGSFLADLLLDDSYFIPADVVGMVRASLWIMKQSDGSSLQQCNS